ncbi:hypothetical protein BMETH_1137_1 [methanotrophic bacterial endosymbiont of Bathymodiolus sp.]|nr:hypothetical protein BMETH_1137_1 [methanotrophic bacterial endosymbiont of Bathymodiolus sp.]
MRLFSELIVIESKMLKQAHSRLNNCFSNAAIGKNSAVRNPQSWPREV